jgi:hypothetical protein
LYLLENDPAELKKLGWYSVQKIDVSYNPDLARLKEYRYEIKEDWVEETPVIENYTEQEINDRNQRRHEEYVIEVRQQRNMLLQASDWTQLSDIQSKKTPEWIESWATYRQQLRDLPESIQVGQEVSWPTAPEV